ncbi:MAG: hypothetical protein K8F30_03370, partial [Taibaiella sp.]|nr:hypothetical protein [Taibaiella sp.]
MMNRTLAILSIIISFISASSCNPKKNEVTPSVNALIEREWLLEYDGVDANRNGKLESDERDYPFHNKEFFTFNNGGSGKYKNVGEAGDVISDADFKWRLNNN